MLTRSVRAVVVVLGVTLPPTAVFAQAVITGTVKDPSGGVLPGVTVEAAKSGVDRKSPVLKAGSFSPGAPAALQN